MMDGCFYLKLPVNDRQASISQIGSKDISSSVRSSQDVVLLRRIFMMNCRETHIFGYKMINMAGSRVLQASP